MTYLLALDQGTSSSRSIVFDANGRIVARAQQELAQIYPQPGWVEHDPQEIWRTQLATAREALARAGIQARDVRAIGITNQRETTVVWNRATGVPVHHAIVWQDRRADLRQLARTRAGRHNPVENRAVGGCLFFRQQAQVDSGPCARCQATGEKRRTGLRHGGQLVAVAPHRGRRSRHRCQQRALFGQACFKAGMVKNTYGTGCFMLMHTGTKFRTSHNGLISTSAAQPTAQTEFAMKGSVFVGGAVVQWLRDGLHAITDSSEVQALAESVPDTGGVMVVPAFTGLGAPYWKPDARGSITGLTRGSTVAHIARAALESIAFQSAALLQAMSRDAMTAGGHAVAELRIDGGASVNDFLMQFQADLLGIPVVRPAVTETTALGAAYLAGLAIGVFQSADELTALWRAERRFLPTLAPQRAKELMARWEHAVRQTVL